MAPYFDQLAEFENQIHFADPVERIDAWIGLQMELAAGPCHAMTRMLGDIPPELSELRKEMICAARAAGTRVLLNAVEPGSRRFGAQFATYHGHDFEHGAVGSGNCDGSRKQ